MAMVRFKDKDKSGHVTGLGTLSHSWTEVDDAQLDYFEQLHTFYGDYDEEGNRPVVRKQSLSDFGIEVKQSTPPPKKEDSE